MSSKIMSYYAGVLLLFAVAIFLYGTFFGKWIDEIWFFIVMSTMFNVSSEIKKDLEQIKENQKTTQ
tara:strand:+ start:868 stop:1065 length:198 start_codon:yes stop_codon:yes gene_type:complete